jgi:hypothetical protein
MPNVLLSVHLRITHPLLPSALRGLDHLWVWSLKASGKLIAVLHGSRALRSQQHP